MRQSWHIAINVSTSLCKQQYGQYNYYAYVYHGYFHAYIYIYKNSQAVKSVRPQKARVKKDVESKVAAKKWL